MLATPFAATTAFAMENELKMLEDAVTNEFNMLGITEYTMGDLTLSQLAEIRAVAQTNDYNQTEKKQQIEVILHR